MNPIKPAVRVIGRAAGAATAAAGTVGSVLINGTVGGIRGTAAGAQRGLRDSRTRLGSDSTPAAALGLAVVGATGLVDWPVLLVVGGTALTLRRLRGRAAPGDPRRPAVAPARETAVTARPAKTPAKKAPAKKAPAKKAPAKTAARKAPAADAVPRKGAAAKTSANKATAAKNPGAATDTTTTR